jgi:L-2-hydroxycarboxylate dehydrogenase (NAD+)
MIETYAYARAGLLGNPSDGYFVPMTQEATDRLLAITDGTIGVGTVIVDNAFHYLWGGGYVIEAAKKGYIAYTNCTAATAEVVPYLGRFPTLGTNPHSWAFPTQDIVGFPICIDFATSTIAAGRVQQLRREGKPLPPGAAIDETGHETTDPSRVRALLPVGGHKGYGLALVDELLAACIGGSLPTLRSRWSTPASPGEKKTCTFLFQCTRPDALGCDDFAFSRSQADNIKAVIDDIRGHGNESCLLPGEPEARAATASARHDGLLFTTAEIEALERIARSAGLAFDRSALRPAQ